MAERIITSVEKDNDGKITAVCNPGATWSPRSVKDVINDIENDIHSYHLDVAPMGKVKIKIFFDWKKGKYLRTDLNKALKNHLEEMG